MEPHRKCVRDPFEFSGSSKAVQRVDGVPYRFLDDGDSFLADIRTSKFYCDVGKPALKRCHVGGRRADVVFLCYGRNWSEDGVRVKGNRPRESSL
jgi:hypothetical protein